MKMIVAIGIGSFIGGILRYLLTQLIQSKLLSTFPFGTLSVNIIGCFLIGVAFGFSERAFLPVEWRLFIVTGFLGGFTTFSSFSIEAVALIRNGQSWYAVAYVALSVIIGLIATLAGLSVTKLF